MSSLSAIQQTVTYVQNGFAFDVNRVQTPIGEGVSVPPICNFIAVPKAIIANYVCLAQTATAGVAFTLSSTYMSMFNGTPVVVLDCARALRVTCNANLTANTKFTFTGYDINYKALTSTFTIIAGQSIGITLSAFLMVSGGSCDVNITTTFTVGTTDYIGLPYYLAHLSDVNVLAYNDLYPGITTGTVSIGWPWRIAGDTAADTSDANGLILLPSASNAAKILRVQYYCYGADSQVNAILNNQEAGAFPNATSTQTICNSMITYARIQRNASNTQYVYGTLVAQDLLGPRYPNDSQFLTNYRAVLAS